MLTERLFHIAQGGAEIILWLLIALSVISIGLILERWMTLRSVMVKSNRNRTRMKEALQSYNLADLEDMARDKESLEGRALAYGLRHAKECGTHGLSEIFQSYALLERLQLERSLSFLATVDSNAPFIGLLGTVLGIMKAFKDLSANASSGNEPSWPASLKRLSRPQSVFWSRFLPSSLTMLFKNKSKWPCKASTPFANSVLRTLNR